MWDTVANAESPPSLQGESQSHGHFVGRNFISVKNIFYVNLALFIWILFVLNFNSNLLVSLLSCYSYKKDKQKKYIPYFIYRHM